MDEARPRGRPTVGERVPLGLRVTPEMKKRLDAAATQSGRSQSQEAEIRLARSFERDDLLDDVFGKAAEFALAILGANKRNKSGHQPWLRGAVQTKGDKRREKEGTAFPTLFPPDAFVFMLEGEADEAVTRPASATTPQADDNKTSTSYTLAEHHHLARRNNLKLYSSSRAAATAADAVLNLIKSSRKVPSRELLAEEIRKELVSQLRRVTSQEPSP